MVLAQGGDLEDLYRPAQVKEQVPVYAEADGYIAALPAMEHGLFAMRLGAGRAVKSDVLDYESGIVFAKKVGDPVQKGDLVATIYTNLEICQKNIAEFQKNVKILDKVVSVSEIIEIVS